jgi:hypothetical protein
MRERVLIERGIQPESKDAGHPCDMDGWSYDVDDTQLSLSEAVRFAMEGLEVDLPDPYEIKLFEDRKESYNSQINPENKAYLREIEYVLAGHPQIPIENETRAWEILRSGKSNRTSRDALKRAIKQVAEIHTGGKKKGAFYYFDSFAAYMPEMTQRILRETMRTRGEANLSKMWALMNSADSNGTLLFHAAADKLLSRVKPRSGPAIYGEEPILVMNSEDRKVFDRDIDEIGTPETLGRIESVQPGIWHVEGKIPTNLTLSPFTRETMLAIGNELKRISERSEHGKESEIWERTFKKIPPPRSEKISRDSFRSVVVEVAIWHLYHTLNESRTDLEGPIDSPNLWAYQKPLSGEND